MIVLCEWCGKENHKPLAHAKRVKHHFCNKECRDKAQSQKVEKVCVVCGTSVLVSPSMAARFSTCSKKCQRANRTKENNGNWRGGITSSRKADMSLTEYKEWRQAVFERDKFTCVFCKKKGGDLNADHIKPWAYFPELRYEVSNGRTLCLDCHKTTYKEVFKWRRKMDGTDLT